MSKFKLQKVPNLAEQELHIKRKYPDFKVRIQEHKMVVVRGELRPTARSCMYSFRLVYPQGQPPKVHILNPPLQKGQNGEKTPHLYGDKSLCLYLPNTGQFGKYDLLSETIIPWISLWLFYYEDWLVNGNVWNGGGVHPI